MIITGSRAPRTQWARRARTVTGGQETPFKDHGDEMVVSIVMGVSQ